VQVCSFYLKGEASQWFDWLSINVDHCIEWEVSKEELVARFGPAELDHLILYLN